MRSQKIPAVRPFVQEEEVLNPAETAQGGSHDRANGNKQGER